MVETFDSKKLVDFKKYSKLSCRYPDSNRDGWKYPQTPQACVSTNFTITACVESILLFILKKLDTERQTQLQSEERKERDSNPR